MRLLSKPPLNFGKGSQRCCFPGLDQLSALAKPSHSVPPTSGANHQIGFAAPVGFGLALQDLEAAVDDVEHIAGLRAGTGGGQVHGDNVGCPELAGQGGWDLHAHCAIHEELPLVAHRLKQSGIGAPGANRVEHLPVPEKGHGIASTQVGGEDAQRDAHLLKTNRS